MSDEKEVVAVSSTPQRFPLPNEVEVAELIKRQAELEERKQRLLDLQQIEGEQSAI